MAKWTVDGILNAQLENDALRSKISKQRTEDIKWMRGEEDGS